MQQSTKAKTNGTREVTSINPAAVAKTAAKQAIDEALKAKNNEIDARTDLTAEENPRPKQMQKLKLMQRKKQSIKQQPTQQSTKLSQLEQEKSLQSIQRR